MRKHFSFETLIEDPGFRKWVLDPTPGIDEEWRELRDRQPWNRQVMDEAREFLLSVEERTVPLTDARRKALWEKIKQKSIIRQEPRILPLYESTRGREGSPSNRRMLLAACVALILASAALFHWYVSTGPGQSPLPRMITKSTGPGQKSEVHLPDGSVVFLNSESKLVYDEHFSKMHRFVEMEGEVFFEVAKNPEIPFVVKSRNVLTTALGTSFNINAARESDISILLVSGKVKVNEVGSRGSKFLTPRERIRYKEGEGLLAVMKAGNMNETLWKDGIIVFEDTSMKEVITTLERWYGVDIQVTGDISGLTFSGTYEKEYLSNVLESMAFVLNVEFELDGNIVKLNFLKI